MDSGFDGGLDLKKLLQMVIPVVGGIAGDPAQQTGFQQGWLHGQSMAQQERERKQALQTHQSETGARYTTDIFDKLNAIDNPDEFVQLRDLAAKHAPPGVNPSDFSAMQFPQEKLETKKRKAIADQLDALERGGYNLDDLSTGRHADRTEGRHVAADWRGDRPDPQATDRDGRATGPEARKADTNASTDYGRFLSRYARGKGKTVDTLTAAEELDARKTFNTVDDKPANGPAPASVDSQFNDLVSIWKDGHQGQEPPAAVRTQLRVQAKKQIGQADDRPTAVTEPIGPEDVQGAVQAILSGRMAPSQLTLVGGMGSRGVKFKQAVVAGVNKQNPEFNWQQAESGYKFGSSAATQNTVRFLDNIEKTLPVLQQASNDFKRSGVRVINKALLASKSQFGNTDVVKFEFARNILADEIAKILQGGGTGSGTSDAKLHQALDLLGGDMTPQQFDTALSVAKELLGTRRESLTKGTFMERKPGGAEKSALDILAARRAKQGAQ
jgi:hypothetical protein